MSNRLWLATPTRSVAGFGGCERAIEHALVAARRRRPWSAYGACSQPASSASTASIARFAPFTMRTSIRRAAPRPPRRRPTRTARRAPRASRAGTPAARCRPAVRGTRARRARAERGDGEVEVAVLLHVEVHELGRRCRERDAVHAAAAARRCARRSGRTRARRGSRTTREIFTDTHCTSVALQARADRVEPRVGFVVAEDRLAEQVDVGVEAGPAPALEMRGERGVVRGEDDTARLGLDARPHALAPRAAGTPRTNATPRAAARADRSGRTTTERRRDELAQAPHRACRVVGAQDLVGQREQQLASRFVGEQPSEAPGPPALTPGRLLDARASRSAAWPDAAAASVASLGSVGSGGHVHGHH